LSIDKRLIPETLEIDQSNSKCLDVKSKTLPEYILKMSGKHQAALCFLAMLSTLINLVPLELQRRIIDDAIANKFLDLLIYLGIVYALSLVLYQITKLIFRIYQGWVAESTIKNTRKGLIELHSNNEKNNDNEGEAVSVISTEVESIGTYVGEHISDASSNIMMLIGVTGYMFLVEPKIAIFALLFLIPQIALVPFMQKLLNRLIKKRVKLVRTLSDTISEIKDPVSETPEIVKSIYLNRMRFTFVKYTMKALINFLNTLGPLTVLIYGGYLAIEGQTTAGVIVAFLSGFQRMSGPVRGLIGFYRLSAQTSVQYHMLKDWIKETKSAST